MNFRITAASYLKCLIIVFAGVVVAGHPALAATLYWNGTGTWDLNTTQNWGTVSGGPYNTATWTDNSPAGVDTATFEGPGGVVTLNTNVSALGLAYNGSTTGDYTIQGTGILTLGAAASICRRARQI